MTLKKKQDVLQQKRISPPRVFLITGYAQSGKDTLADAIIGILGPDNCSKISFADPLKGAANEAFKSLSLERVDFRREEWKVKHRKVLVAIAEAARDEDIDVFAELASHRALAEFYLGKSLVVPDWRYTNEYDIFDEAFGDDLVTVRMWRNGTRAGHAAEQISIQGIEDNCILDYVGVFNDGDKGSIANFARHIIEKEMP